MIFDILFSKNFVFCRRFVDVKLLCVRFGIPNSNLSHSYVCECLCLYMWYGVDSWIMHASSNVNKYLYDIDWLHLKEEHEYRRTQEHLESVNEKRRIIRYSEFVCVCVFFLAADHVQFKSFIWLDESLYQNVH